MGTTHPEDKGVGVGLTTLPIKMTCYKSFNDKKTEYSPGQEQEQPRTDCDDAGR